MHPTPQQGRNRSDSEDVSTVGQLVAAILDGVVGDLPAEIAEIVKLRSATRRVLEAGLAPADEERFLRALARQAARSALPLWSLQALEAELIEPDPPMLLPREAVARARTLRRWGNRECPTCRQP
jgi:hypothetical protein